MSDGEPRRTGNRTLLILLVVSIALMVIGVVRCSFELAPGEQAGEGVEVEESQ
ncbi:MAG: hypothetical protein GF400_05930 [Candidatus Eisenbacteria bacterium]|nr:hypothetical protein [Candidatus Eisenbacteria bacterium]